SLTAPGSSVSTPKRARCESSTSRGTGPAVAWRRAARWTTGWCSSSARRTRPRTGSTPPTTPTAAPGPPARREERTRSTPGPGAPGGGTQLHMFRSDGNRVAFTYEDHVLANLPEGTSDKNQRNVGVCTVIQDTLRVPTRHPRNHDGSAFSVLVTRTANDPRPGSDEISRAFEAAWVRTHGYV